MKDIRKLKSYTNLLIISTLLIILVIFMMLTSPEFFQEPAHKDPEVYSELTNGWHRIELGAFSISTPNNYRYVKQQGIDSYVGLITDKVDSIYFDYGWYSNDFDSPEYKRSYDTISGVSAIVALTDDRIAGVHFSNIKGDNGLTVYSATWNNDLASQIIKTIHFPSHSGITTKKLGTNIVLTSYQGEELFNTNCIQCHTLDNVRIGPPLRGVVTRTSKEWFVNWVINPTDFIKSNTKAAELFKDYSETEHPDYPFTDEQLDELIEYVEAEK